MRYVFLAFAILVTVGTYLLPASGADLRIPMPKSRPVAAKPVPALVPPVKSCVELSKDPDLSKHCVSMNSPEECLHSGNEPRAGQTLQPDETCPTKLRWKNPAK